MVNTRRSSGGGNRTTAGSRQSTLSFNHRVTKSVPKGTKDLSSKPAKQSPLVEQVSSASPEPGEEEVTKDESQQEAEAEEEEGEPLAKLPEVRQQEKSEAELRAAGISDRQIDQYWRRLERERIAKRVHQEGLTLAEKVLRYWDVSSQYGPYVGITRVKRWKRADKLGLNPPLEVLAVLQKEEAKGTTGFEKAQMDEILNSTAITGA
ncbi:DNA polymerase delta, subunit 4-domain-containing protein [Daldinia caldariorum]|uniref:DNA polymerase delta, subunit 4-domain-containing protein n=1 Tax=Daldinia caldariorum TaxID=326644 RepID=UPI0020089B30|nr:DNA polymerase delta, subunit 4-domain-containing protein [Daldinia caldariorum]KAI1471091.1 DNA polymerase delta, subunit 4-domain-containing protein [Daldinia caldariorum]